MNVKYVKVIGLLGALLSGVFQCFSGDVATGAGIVAAALSSAGAFTTRQ